MHLEGLFMGGDGDKGTNFLKEGGEDAEGAVLTCPCLDPNASTAPEAKAFADAYRAEYKEDAGIYSSERGTQRTSSSPRSRTAVRTRRVRPCSSTSPT